MIELDQQSLTLIKQLIHHYLPNTKASVFGSRVNGTAKPYSDLDVVLISNKKIPIEKINELKFALSDSELTIMVDIVDWHDIPESFRKQIGESAEVLI